MIKTKKAPDTKLMTPMTRKINRHGARAGGAMDPKPHAMPALASADRPFIPNQQDMRSGASSRVQKMVVSSIQAGPMHDSAPPRRKRSAAMPPKLLTEAVSIRRAPQTMTMTDTNRPMGSFCRDIVTGYAHTR